MVVLPPPTLTPLLPSLPPLQVINNMDYTTMHKDMSSNNYYNQRPLVHTMDVSTVLNNFNYNTDNKITTTYNISS